MCPDTVIVGRIFGLKKSDKKKIKNRSEEASWMRSESYSRN